MPRPILAQIRDHVAHTEISSAARDFADTARIFALARGSVSEARRLAYETGNSRVVDVFERAEPGSLGGTSPQWGEELGGYRQSAEGFIASLRNDGAFDAALPFMVRVPFRTKLAVSVSAVTATETTEAEDKACLRSRLHRGGTRTAQGERDGRYLRGTRPAWR